MHCFDVLICLIYLSQEGTKDLDALFGKAKYQEMRRNFSGALELVNQAVVAFPNYLPSLIEKMKLQLALRNWEECVDAAHRCDTSSLPYIGMNHSSLIIKNAQLFSNSSNTVILNGSAYICTLETELIIVVDFFETPPHSLLSFTSWGW